MLNFHCHILPSIDDGSKDLEESLLLLDMEEKCGVDTIVLTPHFYADYMEYDHYLKKRDEKYQLLKKAYKGKMRLLLGCELHYFYGVSRSDICDDLCVENSDLLLLELPFSHKADLSEIIYLNSRLQVVLAHIERYLDYYSDKEIMELVNRGVLLQINGETFKEEYFNSRIRRLFEKGCISFIGSDAHNPDYRIPNLDRAKEFIEKHYSKEAFVEFDNNQKSILEGRSFK